MPLKIGIVGCGRISGLHAAAYRRSSEAEITAVCDIDHAVAAACADAWGVPRSSVFSDFDVMLARADIDAVEIRLFGFKRGVGPR